MFWQTFVFIQAYKACLNLARFLLNLGSYSFTLLLPCSAVRILASSCWCVTHRLYQARNKLDLVWGHSVLTTRSEYMENKLGSADLSLAVVCCQVWKAVCAASIAACRSADGENDEFWTFFCQTWVSSVDMSGTEQRTWIQKSHSDQYTFYLSCKTFQLSAHLSSGRVGHLEALTWSCLFPPYNWNISRSIRPHFQFHSPFSGNTILSTQLTSHWCKTHGKAAALKKDSYNFSAAEKEQGLVKDDIF